jgi:hypothetical protein
MMVRDDLCGRINGMWKILLCFVERIMNSKFGIALS